VHMGRGALPGAAQWHLHHPCQGQGQAARPSRQRAREGSSGQTPAGSFSKESLGREKPGTRPTRKVQDVKLSLPGRGGLGQRNGIWGKIPIKVLI
jgi:hypothetical protein